MKNLSISLWLVLYSCTMVAMDSSTMGSGSLTKEEIACMQWCSEQVEIKAQTYKGLSQEDQTILTNGTPYSQQPEKITQALQNYAARFCDLSAAQGASLKYDKTLLGSALLKSKIAMNNKTIEKPTDYMTARMYVFSQLLTKEERSTVLKENYLKDPQAAHAVVRKSADLLAEELVKLNLIADSADARKEAAQNYIAMKIEEFEKTYKS